MTDQSPEKKMGQEKASIPPGASQSQSSKPDTGCLRGAALGCGIVLALVIGVAIVISLRFTNFMRYGLTQAIVTMERTIDTNKSINTEEFQELKNYLGSLRQFVVANEMTRENMIRYQTVAEAFRRALQDNIVGHSEIISIRRAVQEAALTTNPQPQTGPTPAAVSPAPGTGALPQTK
jgi:hypothetical protein